MVEKAYPRPDVEMDELLSALVEAGAQRAAVRTTDRGFVELSIARLAEADLDEIWSHAIDNLVSKLCIDPALIKSEDVNEDLEKVTYNGRQLVGLRYKHDKFARDEWVRATEEARIRRTAGQEPNPEDFLPYA